MTSSGDNMAAVARPAGQVSGLERKVDVISASGIKRDKWARKADFILACIGFAVGLGNVWRFPYLCYKNGGGAFFIPYFIMLVAGGVPVFFLEVALGQFMAEGGISVWNICPLFRGIGIGTTVVTFLLNIYYILILAWALLFMCYSFTSVLPWAHCNNTWNTPNCSLAVTNVTDNHTVGHTVDPSVEFWRYKILNESPGIHDLGGVQWELALCLLAVWIVCYFCVWKGVKSTGKVVYFTATFPYVVLTILLIRGVTLQGADVGIEYYLKPNFTKLGEPEVWIDAGTQIFFSYAIALGALTALGSYNEFHNDCFKDVAIIAVVNSFTSIYAGFVIFSVLGFMAHQQKVPIGDVASKGPGLAFIAYPKALAQMPVAPLWSVLFFFMIQILGLDSQFVGIEGFVTAVLDVYPNVLRRGYNREIFIAVISTISYLIGLVMVTNGGIYVFQIWDYYSASGMTLLWFCFWESIAIAYFYGAERFYQDVEYMIGYRIFPWFKWCWLVFTPLITMGILLFSIIDFEYLQYEERYTYPAWAQAFGLCLATVSMVCVPGYLTYAFFVTPGSSIKERFFVLITPKLRPHQIHSSPVTGSMNTELDAVPEVEGLTNGYRHISSGDIIMYMDGVNDGKKAEEND